MRCGRASPLALGGRGVPSGDGNGGLDRYQDSAYKVSIAGVLDVAAEGDDRDSIRGGV